MTPVTHGLFGIVFLKFQVGSDVSRDLPVVCRWFNSVAVGEHGLHVQLPTVCCCGLSRGPACGLSWWVLHVGSAGRSAARLSSGL